MTAALVVLSARAQVPDARALRPALQGTDAVAVLLDVASGRVLGNVGDPAAGAAPGSVVKPFVLRAALDAGVITERTEIHCTNSLRVAGHNLACVHPRDVTVLDARQALAESCNTYFATAAQRMPAAVLVKVLKASGFAVTGSAEPVDARELMALGLAGVRVSVRGLAEAYRGLAVWMASDDAHARVVRDGLLASVNTGVAHAAFVPGLQVVGKTGTVDDPGGRSRGWFAGVVYGAGGRPERVVVVYVPGGNGRDAAELARRVLAGAR